MLAGKRKADTEATAPPKKKKLANDDTAAVTDDPSSRTVFVGRLSWNVDNDWLKSEFKECGEVVGARVQMDRNTGKSRGFAYVEFADATSVEKALQLSGKDIDGRPINVDRSTNNKSSGGSGNPPNEGRRAAYGDKTSPPAAVTDDLSSRTVFVGRLSWNVDNDWLKSEFEECGEVVGARVQMDRNTGKSRGFAYIWPRIWTRWWARWLRRWSGEYRIALLLRLADAVPAIFLGWSWWFCRAGAWPRWWRTDGWNHPI